ncbi:ABC transporter permease subunit [Rhabdaerophilum sp. SD176]|uniref:ABC transporter permease n=1 Tax=Rhabdaerophilum sp. SD176 TaxID=2983548 RepID=UPI0024E00724|nr:ABC transporter permease subunit [Rhabdaerophilum sp. SD176]
MFDALITYRVQLLTGAGLTILVAVASLMLATGIGLLGAMAKLYGPRVTKIALGAYTTVMRGIPDLVVILLIYFGGTVTLSKLRGSYFEVEPFTAGVVALGIISGAYMTEVFRGAIQAVPKGQIEAARALGLRPFPLFTLVILPQAWRIALPGFGNQWLILLKHTSLISVVGLEELMRKSVIVAGATQQPFTIYSATAVSYLVMTILSMQALKRFERRLERSYQR